MALRAETKVAIGLGVLAAAAGYYYLVYKPSLTPALGAPGQPAVTTAPPVNAPVVSASGSLPAAAPLSLPPLPTVALVSSPVYASPTYAFNDKTDPTSIVQAQEMTCRQLQAAYNLLGCSPPLQVTGRWGMPEKQATWDFQFLHQNDNPSSPLNVTGEIDQLTHTAIQAAVGKKTGVQAGFV